MTNEPWRFTMFHRAAATTAAILAPFGVALAVPAVSSTVGVQAAFAGDDNGPADDLGDENLPEDGGQQSPAPVPVLPQLPPRPQDTLEDDGTNDASNNSSDGSGDDSRGDSGNDESENSGSPNHGSNSPSTTHSPSSQPN